MFSFLQLYAINTTFNNGSLGSRIDEERSEMRYVMWIAEFSESSNLWTHLAPLGIPRGTPVWVSWNSQNPLFFDPFLGFGKGVLDLEVQCLPFTFESELLSNKLVGSALLILNVIRCFYVLDLALSFGCLLLTVSRTMMVLRSLPFILVEGWTHKNKTLTSNRVRLPAELKHINKRRKRN